MPPVRIYLQFHSHRFCLLLNPGLHLGTICRLLGPISVIFIDLEPQGLLTFALFMIVSFRGTTCGYLKAGRDKRRFRFRASAWAFVMETAIGRSDTWVRACMGPTFDAQPGV